FVNPLGRQFDFGPWRQFESIDRRWRHHPEETLLRAQRVFEQDRVRIQNPALDVSQVERHGLCQGGVLWAGLANPALDLLELDCESIDFVFRSRSLGIRMFAGQKACLLLGLRRYQTL